MGCLILYLFPLILHPLTDWSFHLLLYMVVTFVFPQYLCTFLCNTESFLCRSTPFAFCSLSHLLPHPFLFALSCFSNHNFFIHNRLTHASPCQQAHHIAAWLMHFSYLHYLFIFTGCSAACCCPLLSLWLCLTPCLSVLQPLNLLLCMFLDLHKPILGFILSFL